MYKHTHISPLLPDLTPHYINLRLLFTPIKLSTMSPLNIYRTYMHILSHSYNIRASLRSILQVPRTTKPILTDLLNLQHQDSGIHCLITLCHKPLDNLKRKTKPNQNKKLLNITFSIYCAVFVCSAGSSLLLVYFFYFFFIFFLFGYVCNLYPLERGKL